MKWKNIFKELMQERTISIPYEATLGVQLDCIIGDIPIYKFRVQYLKENEAGLVTECIDTFSELLDLVEREPAFRKCSHCGELIVDGFYSNSEMKKEYCSVACMAKSMNKMHGKGNWRFKAATEPIEESENNEINFDEYQFELLTDEVSIETFRYLLEEKGGEPELAENGQAECKIKLADEMWVPYKMMWCPPL